MDEKAEALTFLKCDRVVNEVVSKVDKFVPAIINVLKKKELDQEEIELLKLSSHTFVCERIMARIEERQFRDTEERIDLGCMCSKKEGSCVDCLESVCKLMEERCEDLVIE